jgi:hypothetical protein
MCFVSSGMARLKVHRLVHDRVVGLSNTFKEFHSKPSIYRTERDEKTWIDNQIEGHIDTITDEIMDKTHGQKAATSANPANAMKANNW